MQFSKTVFIWCLFLDPSFVFAETVSNYTFSKACLQSLADDGYTVNDLLDLESLYEKTHRRESVVEEDCYEPADPDKDRGTDFRGCNRDIRKLCPKGGGPIAGG